jgi:hypothetical protein
VGDEHAQFVEGFRVKQLLDPLARSLFPLRMLGVKAFLATAQGGLFANLI